MNSVGVDARVVLLPWHLLHVVLLLLLLLDLLPLFQVGVLVGYQVEHVVLVVLVDALDNVIVEDGLEEVFNVIGQEVLNEPIDVNVLIFIVRANK